MVLPLFISLFFKFIRGVLDVAYASNNEYVAIIWLIWIVDIECGHTFWHYCLLKNIWSSLHILPCSFNWLHLKFYLKSCVPWASLCHSMIVSLWIIARKKKKKNKLKVWRSFDYKWVCCITVSEKCALMGLVRYFVFTRCVLILKVTDKCLF